MYRTKAEDECLERDDKAPSRIEAKKTQTRCRQAQGDRKAQTAATPKPNQNPKPETLPPTISNPRIASESGAYRQARNGREGPRKAPCLD